MNVSEKIPWYYYGIAISWLLSFFGAFLDCSWHHTIGRDFSIPLPHVIIASGPMYTLFVSLYLAYKETFRSSDHSCSINIGKIWAPSGAWLVIIGNILFFAGFSLDNRWHEIYGLDNTPISSSHLIVYLSGIIMILGSVGLFLQLLFYKPIKYHRIIWICCILVITSYLGISALTYAEFTVNLMHNASTYFIAVILLQFLVGIAMLSPIPYSATLMASIYTACHLAFQVIVSSIPAHPDIGPVYTPVDHFIPSTLNFMLPPVGLALDLFNRYAEISNWLLKTLCMAILGFSIFVMTQWIWSDFMLSDFAKDWVYARKQFAFYVDMKAPWWQEFWIADKDPSGNFSLSLFLWHLLIPFTIFLSASIVWVSALRFVKKLQR